MRDGHLALLHRVIFGLNYDHFAKYEIFGLKHNHVTEQEILGLDYTCVTTE
jgi:hypothetical protein